MSKGLGRLQRQLLTTMATKGMTVATFKRLPVGVATFTFTTWALAAQIDKPSRAGVSATGRALRKLWEKGYVQGWHVPRITSGDHVAAGSRPSAWALTPAGEVEAKSKGAGAKMAFAESLLAAVAAAKVSPT